MKGVVFEEVRQRIVAEISEQDRACFIHPYENKQRLDAIRSHQENEPADLLIRA